MYELGNHSSQKKSVGGSSAASLSSQTRQQNKSHLHENLLMGLRQSRKIGPIQNSILNKDIEKGKAQQKPRLNSNQPNPKVLCQSTQNINIQIDDNIASSPIRPSKTPTNQRVKRINNNSGNGLKSKQTIFEMKKSSHDPTTSKGPMPNKLDFNQITPEFNKSRPFTNLQAVNKSGTMGSTNSSSTASGIRNMPSLSKLNSQVSNGKKLTSSVSKSNKRITTPSRKNTTFNSKKATKQIDSNTEAIIKELDMEIQKIKEQNNENNTVLMGLDNDDVIEANDKYPHSQQDSVNDENSFNNDFLIDPSFQEDVDKKQVFDVEVNNLLGSIKDRTRRIKQTLHRQRESSSSRLKETMEESMALSDISMIIKNNQDFVTVEPSTDRPVLSTMNVVSDEQTEKIVSVISPRALFDATEPSVLESHDNSILDNPIDMEQDKIPSNMVDQKWVQQLVNDLQTKHQAEVNMITQENKILKKVIQRMQKIQSKLQKDFNFLNIRVSNAKKLQIDNLKLVERTKELETENAMLMNKIEKFKDVIVSYDYEVMQRTEEDHDTIEQLVSENNNLKYLLLIHDELADGKKMERLIEYKMREAEEEVRYQKMLQRQREIEQMKKLNKPRDVKIKVKNRETKEEEEFSLEHEDLIQEYESSQKDDNDEDKFEMTHGSLSLKQYSEGDENEPTPDDDDLDEDEIENDSPSPDHQSKYLQHLLEQQAQHEKERNSSPSKEEHIELIQYQPQADDEAQQNQEIAADSADSSKLTNQSESTQENENEAPAYQRKQTPVTYKSDPDPNTEEQLMRQKSASEEFEVKNDNDL